MKDKTKAAKPAQKAGDTAQQPAQNPKFTSIKYKGKILDLVLEGTFTAVSPISIRQPDAPEDVVGVPQMTVVTDGGTIDVPHIPGGTFKGFLRNRAADIAAKISSQLLTLPVYYTLYKGGIKQKGKESVQDLLKTVQFRDSNPVLGLFGASDPRWLRGSISVGPAYTLDENSYGVHSHRSVRQDEFRLDPSRLERLNDDAADKYVATTTARRQAAVIEREIKSLRAEFGKAKGDKEATAALKVKETELKAEYDRQKAIAGVTVGMPLGVIHAIAAGSRFNQRIAVQRVHADEVGLLLETLRSLASNCRIGGMNSIGYGLFAVEWQVKVRETPELDYEPAGTISIRQDHADMNLKHPLIDLAVAAWEERKTRPDSFTVLAAVEPGDVAEDDEVVEEEAAA